VLLLLACAAPDDHGAAALGDIATWSWSDPGDATAAALDDATLSAELDAAVSAVPRFDPLEVMNAFGGMLGWGDIACPALDPDWIGQSYFDVDCTAASGAAFQGWALWNWWHGTRDAAGNPCSDQVFYYGFVRAEDPDGAGFEAYGSLQYMSCTEADGTTTWSASIEGDFYSEAADDRSFLSTRQPLSLFWTARDGPGGHELTLDGALSGRTGAVESVRFDALTLTDGEPAGRVTLWDQRGAAYDVDFDGDGDGCAGAVCVDWSPLVDWVGRPWY
jgi:hypothetical protein